jgi:hypothetical protein
MNALTNQTWYNVRTDASARVVVDGMTEKDRMCMLYADGFTGMVHVDTLDTILRADKGWERIV